MTEKKENQIVEYVKGLKESIYTDYRDFENIEYFLTATKEELIKKVFEWYEEQANDIRVNLCKEILKDYKLRKSDFEVVMDIIYEWLSIEYPIDELMRQEIKVNILTKFRDEVNSDFTSNGWLPVLLNKQGYKLSDYPLLKKSARYRTLKPKKGTSFYEDVTGITKKDIEKYNDKKTPFIESVKNEIDEMYIDSMRCLTFLAKMTIEDFYNLVSGKNAIIFGKSIYCGLFNPWSGCGSILEIELEKPITIQPQNIYKIQVENYGKEFWGNYTVNNVYGLTEKCWDRDVKIKKVSKSVGVFEF